MADPLLYITDGDTTVNLLASSSGIFLNDWIPTIAPLKGGGVYQQSVLSEGKQLVMTNYDNAIETFSLKVSAESQDSAIITSQELLRLLEKARAYWTVKFETEPVYLVARSPNETNTRYAIIHNYRQEGLDNPYAQPFFGCVDAALDDITLVVERGHWQATIPGQPECTQFSASSADSIVRTTESVVTGNDDGHVWVEATALTINAPLLDVGFNDVGGAHTWHTGIRFSSVDVDDSSTILQVFLRIAIRVSSNGLTDGQVKFRIYGEAADNAAAWSTYANFMGRARTSSYYEFIQPAPVAAGTVVLYDIIEPFNEVRNRAGWSDGNAMVFFIEFHSRVNPTSELRVQYASFEDATNDEPRILIDHTDPVGETTPSCEDKNYITDKYNQAALTNIYTDDGGVFSANLVNSTAINIYPAVPAVNDAIYFGNVTGPFSNVIMYLDVVQEDLTIIWEYYQGAPTSGWTTIPSADSKDETDDFQNSGYRSFTFAPPRDTTNGSWDTTTVNTVSAYWIRARVSAVGASPVRPETSTRTCYTVTWPYVTIADDEIVGDISAIAAGIFGDEGVKATGKFRRDRLIVALQSERGPYAGQNYNFSAYLPYSDEQLPSAINSISGVSGDFSYATDVTAPSGRAILLNPSGTGTQSVYTTVDSSNFFGKYRVFTRIRQEGGSDNHFFFQVTTQHGSTVYASTNEVPCVAQSSASNANWTLLDLGELNIPTGLPARMAEENVQLDIYMNIRVVNTTGDVYLSDLILMPADEWIADIQDFGDGNWALSNALYIDSAYVPKVDIRGLSRARSGSFVNPVPFKTIAGKFTLPANKGSKLWIVSAYLHDTAGWLSDPGVISKVNLYKSERYLGLRGNR